MCQRVFIYPRSLGALILRSPSIRSLTLMMKEFSMSMALAVDDILISLRVDDGLLPKLRQLVIPENTAGKICHGLFGGTRTYPTLLLIYLVRCKIREIAHYATRYTYTDLFCRIYRYTTQCPVFPERVFCRILWLFQSDGMTGRLH